MASHGVYRYSKLLLSVQHLTGTNRENALVVRIWYEK